MDYSKLSDSTLEKLSKNEPIDYSSLNSDELAELTKYQGGQQAKPVAPVDAPTTPSMLESAGRGAAQGLTFGFADEMQAKAEQLLGDQDYDKRLAEIRDSYKAAADENPITYHGADFLSGFALPLGAVGGMAKGASLAGKLARSAASGAALGGLAGAGTSEGVGASAVAGDALQGAAAGALMGPLVEGGIGLTKHLAKGSINDIGALKDVVDFYKYGKEGIALTGKHNTEKVIKKGFTSIESELMPLLENALKEKNKLFSQAKDKAMTEGRTINVKAFQDMIDKAKAAGVDEKTIAKIQKELDRLSKKIETSVTDPEEYQTLLRSKVAEEADVLKDKAYQLQQKNAEKAGQKAAKEAEKTNQQYLKLAVEKLKITNPTASNEELMQRARQELMELGRLGNPEHVAKSAAEQTKRSASEAFEGTNVFKEPATGTDVAEAVVGSDGKRILSTVQKNEAGIPITDLSEKAGVEINKLADKNAAYAYTLAERENKKATESLAEVYRKEGTAATNQQLTDELKRSGKWIDPLDAAKTAKEQTRLSQKPIDIEKSFSPELGKDIITAKTGDDSIISKILPKFDFKKTENQKPDLDVMDVEALRNQVKHVTDSDNQLDFRSVKELGDLSKNVRGNYNELLGKEAAENALKTDEEVKKSLAELGIDSLIGDNSTVNKIKLRDALANIFATSQTAKGAKDSVKIENAFEGLRRVFKDQPEEKAKIEQVYEKVKEHMRQAYLSDITTGHNTFAIDPGSLSWTMTAGGKIGLVTNKTGLIINKVANSAPGQLLAQAKQFADRGLNKYSKVFEKMSATEDLTKRRALMYTLLQQPDFRETFGVDILGKEESGE